MRQVGQTVYDRHRGILRQLLRLLVMVGVVIDAVVDATVVAGIGLSDVSVFVAPAVLEVAPGAWTESGVTLGA